MGSSHDHYILSTTVESTSVVLRDSRTRSTDRRPDKRSAVRRTDETRPQVVPIVRIAASELIAVQKAAVQVQAIDKGPPLFAFGEVAVGQGA